MNANMPPRAPRDLTGMLAHATHVLNTQLAAALSEIGISAREQCVLAHALEAERTQNQLAELADLDKTTMVVTVDKLEKAGYAERRPSSTDRRARIIHVTEAGRKIAASGQQLVDRVHSAALGALPENTRAVFVDALQELIDGHLAQPAASEQPVRRARPPRRVVA